LKSRITHRDSGLALIGIEEMDVGRIEEVAHDLDVEGRTCGNPQRPVGGSLPQRLSAPFVGDVRRGRVNLQDPLPMPKRRTGNRYRPVPG
jgi:hypothetical protein